MQLIRRLPIPRKIIKPPDVAPYNSTENTDPAASKTSPKAQLRQAIRGSNQVLVSATTTLTLFPDTLTVDRAKLTVTRRWFFRSAEQMSIRIEDILNLTATVGPFLGTIKITSRVFSNERPYHIGRFWRKDALRIKRITQGYIIAMQRKIDCSSLSTPELVTMLDKLGIDDHPTHNDSQMS